MGHNYIGSDFIGHYYIFPGWKHSRAPILKLSGFVHTRHNYIGHNYIGHNYIAAEFRAHAPHHGSRCRPKPRVSKSAAASASPTAHGGTGRTRPAARGSRAHSWVLGCDN